MCKGFCSDDGPPPLTMPEQMARLEQQGVYLEYREAPPRFAPLMHDAKKRRLSVNLPAGCTRGCAYCVQEKDTWYQALPTGTDARSVPAVPALSLGNVRLVLIQRKPLVLSLFDTTDALLLAEDARGHARLRRLLRFVQREASQHLVMLTVRPTRRASYVPAWLRDLARDCRLTVFVSVGSLNPRLDGDLPAAVAFLRICRDAGIHAVPLCKPLVPEWYDAQAAQPLLREVTDGAQELVVGGLKLAPAIVQNLQAAGHPVPQGDYRDTEAHLDSGFLHEFAGQVQRLAPVNIYKHRLCAMYEHHGLTCDLNCNEKEFCLKKSGR